MKRRYTIYIIIFSILFSQDFNEGPYGTNPFDIAGPFNLMDLNRTSLGDTNFDQQININDIIILVNNILEIGDMLDPIEQQIGDLNGDGGINIIDISMLIQVILYPESYDLSNTWIFEDEWNGEETYIFITVGPASSTALWNANDVSELLEKSPNNVHYFFLSNRTTYESDIIQKKATFDLILNGFSEEEQIHWKQHLHFVPDKCDSHNEEFVDAVCNIRSNSIDRFQRWRQVGYLGNPANFSGTYISYLAHEAIYFNYEHNTLYEPNENYDEITIFEREHYTGWWGASISKNITFPSEAELLNYSGMSIELLRGCPDCGLFDGGSTEIECGDVINYADSGCDDYDRIARMFICDEDGSNCNEMARWITPFARQPHHLTDISSFMSMIQSGGNKVIKFQESGWPNSLLTMRFRFYHNNNQETIITPKEYTKMWVGTFPFNPNFDENREPIIFTVPENAAKVEFISYITGHGWSCGGTFQCAEFCNSQHMLSLNGGVHDFQIAFPNGDDNDYCIQPEAILDGTIPNQYGSWGYGRAGWCPGQDVRPWITDITDYVTIGDENIMDYSACRVSWDGSCAAPPTCPGGDCYCPEIAMTSYVIIWY